VIGDAVRRAEQAGVPTGEIHAFNQEIKRLCDEMIGRADKEEAKKSAKRRLNELLEIIGKAQRDSALKSKPDGSSAIG
jgi:hypothetical protein